MTPFAHKLDTATELCRELVATGFGPFYGTPPGVLSPLHRAFDQYTGVLTVAREENAIGIAAGAALTGHHPVVLMQNRGLGSSLGVLASLVVPYRIPLLLVVGLGAAAPGHPAEGALLARITRPLLDGVGMEIVELDPEESLPEQVGMVRDAIRDRHLPTALLVPASVDGPVR